jgi:hypothetical protein
MVMRLSLKLMQMDTMSIAAHLAQTMQPESMGNATTALAAVPGRQYQQP